MIFFTKIIYISVSKPCTFLYNIFFYNKNEAALLSIYEYIYIYIYIYTRMESISATKVNVHIPPLLSSCTQITFAIHSPSKSRHS